MHKNQINKKIFGKIVGLIIERDGRRQNVIARDLAIDPASLNRYLSGKSIPGTLNYYKVKELARKMNLDLDQLLGLN